MSNKLTKEMLDALIQEAMLQEKYEFEGDAEDFLKDLDVGNKAKFNSAPKDKPADYEKTVGPIKGLEDPKDKFTTSDVARAVADKNVDPAVRNAASLIGTRAKDPEFQQEWPDALKKAKIKVGLADKAKDFKAGKAKASIDIDSFSFPRPLNNLSDTGVGKFLGSQNELINSIFSQKTMLGRLQQLDKISKALADEEEIKKLQPRELLQYTMVADLFDLFFNQLDQRTGGYMFEAFLANLVGGSVEGGSNGIADFNSPNGQAGSAKFYKAWSGIEQSLRDLTKVGTSVHYVVGIHGEAAQAAERKKIDLYYVITTLTEINGNEKQITFSDVNGKPINAANFSGNKFLISDYTNAEPFYVGTFTLVKGNGDSYKKVLNDATSKMDSKKESKIAFDAMKSFFKHLYDAEENTKKYTSQKDAADLTAANTALKAYDDADEQLNTLLVTIAPSKNITGTKGSRSLAENKMAELDLMIEHMVKQFLKG